jgi:hypothetical protein|tara:strand:+ start:11603 stop:12064 length:462 start_codon:yes stop_codon:yes gene_type:complete
MQPDIILKYNFLQPLMCRKLISLFNATMFNKMKHGENKEFIDLTDGNFFIEYFNPIKDKCEKFVGKPIDWWQIQKSYNGNSMHKHHDDAKIRTTFSGVIYLNDGFEGGQTFFEDGTIIEPVAGKGLFFDGKNLMHGVSKHTKADRYIIACWFK